MYVFEFWDEARKEFVYMFGYSFEDLGHRYPKEDFSKYQFVSKEYID